MFDEKCMEAISNSNMMVPWYLMAAYAYYEQDEPILSDGMFDGMAKAMLEKWDTIEHWHKDLITTDDLEAGSLLLKDYPDRVKYAVENLKKSA